jgi:Lrp/AsnC family transcriptional regulator, regulator for asnA, asnC and gidA
MDLLDEKILAALREDARIPYVEIAKSVNLSEAAIRRRVANLVQSGAISKFTIETSAGSKTRAISMIAVSPNTPTSEISSKLKKVRGVDSIFEITGEYDVAVVVSGASIVEINESIDEIRKLQGIDTTNTVVVLKTVR